ncbi:uncharacterized protein [Miscanthus floridulus]|uniref:uncharacterized protein n=1 Tax=Miscanthus floridulus TaxID=154761 RepID=UPI0034585E63
MAKRGFYSIASNAPLRPTHARLQTRPTRAPSRHRQQRSKAASGHGIKKGNTPSGSEQPVIPPPPLWTWPPPPSAHAAAAQADRGRERRRGRVLSRGFESRPSSDVCSAAADEQPGPRFFSAGFFSVPPRFGPNFLVVGAVAPVTGGFGPVNMQDRILTGILSRLSYRGICMCPME